MKTADPIRKRARRVVRLLAGLYPDARCALNHTNPLELLIATILSAQCTDTLVNKVTPELFARFPDVSSFAAADPEELEKAIRRVTFFRAKARNIIACCQRLLEHHEGRVPGRMEELVQLPGVGRKTANVILGNVFGVPGIVVDTHVGRLSRRMGLTTETDPVKVERDLMALLPRKEWIMFSHRMIYHGRQVCHARKPRCETCALAKVCPKIGVETGLAAHPLSPAAGERGRGEGVSG
ncbi:MAG TPA: endonuclease III [Gemmataceae bacterium]|nr:endonuclease III [Gemmataceae bacterium]